MLSVGGEGQHAKRINCVHRGELQAETKLDILEWGCDEDVCDCGHLVQIFLNLTFTSVVCASRSLLHSKLARVLLFIGDGRAFLSVTKRETPDVGSAVVGNRLESCHECYLLYSCSRPR